MSPNRNGNFTSSEIFRLMKKGKSAGSWSVDADTYIEECNMERRLGRSVETVTYARPLSWGRCVERRAFNVLGLDYTLCSHVTIQHPDIPFWWGSPDATTKIAVADLKCPMTLISFCQMVDPYFENGKLIHDALSIEAVRENHKDGDKFFWQIVSNAILTGKKKGQLIAYVPYLEELDEIKTLADGNPDYYWIWAADSERLPYLIKGGHYKNINVIEFDILQRDVDALTDRVLECGKKLIEVPELVTN
jgi:hypothetical protein